MRGFFDFESVRERLMHVYHGSVVSITSQRTIFSSKETAFRALSRRMLVWGPWRPCPSCWSSLWDQQRSSCPVWAQRRLACQVYWPSGIGSRFLLLWHRGGRGCGQFRLVSNLRPSYFLWECLWFLFFFNKIAWGLPFKGSLIDDKYWRPEFVQQSTSIDF